MKINTQNETTIDAINSYKNLWTSANNNYQSLESQLNNINLQDMEADSSLNSTLARASIQNERAQLSVAASNNDLTQNLNILQKFMNLEMKKDEPDEKLFKVIQQEYILHKMQLAQNYEKLDGLKDLNKLYGTIENENQSYKLKENLKLQNQINNLMSKIDLERSKRDLYKNEIGLLEKNLFDIEITSQSQDSIEQSQDISEDKKLKKKKEFDS